MTRILAGHAADQESVFVLRKRTATEYELHKITISKSTEQLRTLFSAEQSIEGELVDAIIRTQQKPPRKPRAKRKAQ